MSWAYSACAVCCFNSTECCHVWFYVSLWGSSVVCVGDFENTIVPYRRPPKLHFKNFNINYPLNLLCILWKHGREKYTECIFKFFTTRLSLFNKYEIYGMTYEYICTYIQTPLAFNMLMWGSPQIEYGQLTDWSDRKKIKCMEFSPKYVCEQLWTLTFLLCCSALVAWLPGS